MENSKKLIGKVNEEERDQIKLLYQRKFALIELFKTIEQNSPLYEKIVHDLGETSTKFQDWWNDNNKKYEWEEKPDHHWEIDFDSCQIFLVKNK